MPRVTKPKSIAKSEPYPLPGDGYTKPNKASGGAKGTWDRVLLVSEVYKATVADYDALGAAVGKTGTQCKDTWRKTVYPALLRGDDWSTAGPGWDTAMKMKLVTAVLGTAKPNWDAVAAAFPGRTKNQVHDIWRKVVWVKLSKGERLL
ncbi:uncharacterized protein EHS24_002782 [Apiotrichum porosum]|uniref:Myb-like domain-containing protein n=1 Tax=Apiotrichum porosum TaxID=105984 RepID=A0A427XHS5_9TREE|nr:uncharacterized protein EHS24_002782 [Apiotrichum porosum]RSH78313.1 hypothetical protein EHS24_002782 [Apiotrichum porosum]